VTVVIGIAGSMRSGKTTLATSLATTYGLPVVSFAESLRMEVSQAFFPKKSKSDARYLWSLLEETDKSKTRPILQAWGQGKRDLVDANYWVYRLFEYLRVKDIKVAICDDVRHANEAQAIIDGGGIIIRLVANGATLIERGADPKTMEHQSENLSPLDKYLKAVGVGHITVDTGGRTPYGVYVASEPYVRRLMDKIYEYWGEEDEEEN